MELIWTTNKCEYSMLLFYNNKNWKRPAHGITIERQIMEYPLNRMW